MIEFTIKDIQFTAGKLSAMDQFHVSRRIMPIIPALLPIYQQLKAAGDSPLSGDLGKLADAMQPLSEVMAHMDDKDAEYIIAKCMAVVKRKHMDNWASVWSGAGLMFDDMDMSIVLPVVIRVIQDSLGPFISGLLTVLPTTPESGPTS